MFKKFIGLALAAGLLAGCTHKSGVDFSVATAPKLAQMIDAKTITYGVQDNRPYVLSGEKPANYVGFMRDTMYQPMSIFTTNSERPLADDLQYALDTSLKASGAKVTSVPLEGGASQDSTVAKLKSGGGERLLLISILDWQNDIYVYRKPLVNYNVTAKVFDQSGKLLAENYVEGKGEMVEYNVADEDGKPAMGFAEKYKSKLKELLTAPQIVAALK